MELTTSRKRPGLRLWAGVLLVVGATLYLMATAFRGAATYYLSAEEALSRAAGSPEPLSVRIRGTVWPGTLRFDPAAMELRFGLGPDPGESKAGAPASGEALAASPTPSRAPRIEVIYRGAPPDNLSEGKPVIVEGRLAGDGRLTATLVLVTCPSRYEPEPKPSP